MMFRSFRRKSVLAGFMVLTVAILMSCSTGSGGGDEKKLDPTSVTTDLSFNVSGAKAIAASTSSSSSSSMRSASSLGDLVKIKEDGTLETAITFGSNNSWKPTVSFISVGADKSVYICFQSIYSSWDSTTQKSTSIQFVRVYPDNHFDVLWPLDPTNYNYSSDGYVYTWTWAGMDSDPLQKGDDGQLYFKVSSYSGSTNRDFVYSYDPSAGGKPILRTPANGSLSIESFKIDSQKHLFIKSSSGTSSFLRYYTQGVTAPVNVYYNSDSNGWLRSYMPNTTGTALIMNGYNINGMSGIIRANLPTSGSPTCELLYPQNLSSTWVNLQQNGDSTNGNAIMSYNNSTYLWDPSVLTNSNLDKEKLLARVASYFYSTPTITDSNFATLASSDLNDSTTYTLTTDSKGTTTTYSGLGGCVCWNGEAFLRTYFSGKLMKDWLAEKNMTNFYVDYIANLVWGTDGSLYGVYNPSCYMSTDTARVVKLLDSAGNKALDVIALKNGSCKPSKIKIVGGYLYYRYAVMNGATESGYHKLARFNFASSTEEELFTDSSLSGKHVELYSYDISSDNTTMYISALDYATNDVIFGKIDLTSKKFTQIPADASYGTVRTF